jgi:hypothetical protein
MGFVYRFRSNRAGGPDGGTDMKLRRLRASSFPPGHNVKIDEDAEIIMFSPQHEHSHVIDHMIRKARG